MASSREPDNDFGVRVEKVFGSLHPVHSSESAPLWSVPDTEVGRRDQNREERKVMEKDQDSDVVSSSEDREGLEAESGGGRCEADGEVEDRVNGGVRGGLGNAGVGDGEDWEIRSSIEMDPTLDDGREEVLFDKGAVGRENAGAQTNMRDATDNGSGLNSQSVLTNSHDANKDPHIDDFAVQIGLKESGTEAQSLFVHSCCRTTVSAKEPQHQGSACVLKSILKRKGDSIGPESRKHVNFDLSKNDYNEAPTVAEDFPTDAGLVEIELSENDSMLVRHGRGVPDYVLNPFKYRRYSLDSSSDATEDRYSLDSSSDATEDRYSLDSSSDATEDRYSLDSSSDATEDSKSQACAELLEQMKRSKAQELGLELKNNSIDLRKSPTLMPKKKVCSAKVASTSSQKKNQDAGCRGSSPQTGLPIGISTGEVHQNKVGIDEEPVTVPADGNLGSKNPIRHQRRKTASDD